MLVNGKVITVGMARKSACNGNTSLHHLEIVYKRNGKDGRSALLAEFVSRKVRVSRLQKLLHLLVV